ncbi:MAG: response regulator [Sulfurimonas sp.]|nr:response regulator [Sulfurimonas sp.]
MSNDFTDEKLTILVCESDTRILKRLELWVKAMGDEPIVCDDGIIALQIFEEKKPDILLVSQNINSIGSMEFIESIKNRTPSQVVVLMVDEEIDTSIFRKSIDLQVDRYLNKPLDANAVFSMVELLSSCLKRVKVQKKELEEGA